MSDPTASQLLWLAAADPLGTTTPEASVEAEEALARPWNVVVLNDPVNLMRYVVMVFRRVFGYSQEKATKHMLEVHQLGRSRVWTGDKEKAEAFVHTLQEWQLTAILEPEDQP